MAKTANRLIALGENDAYLSLLALAAEHHRDREDDYSAIWLCLLVYDPKPDEGLPIPKLGGPQFPGINSRPWDKDNAYLPGWPRFPLAISRDVPFLVVFNYILAGEAEPSADYIKRCRTFGTFRTKPYPIATHDQAAGALKALTSSPEWTALPWKEWSVPMESQFLQKQVDRIKDE